MEWALQIEYSWRVESATYGVWNVDNVKEHIPEEFPVGPFNAALVQYHPAEDWVNNPYEVILSTLFADYMVSTIIPNSVHQYRSGEWADARDCFIYQCKKHMEQLELRCANCGKDTAWLVRDGKKLVCPMCFNGTETVSQLIDKEMEK